MKKILLTAFLVIFLVGCAPQITYSTFSDGAFSAKYPEWQGVKGEDVAVQEADCRAAIKLEAVNINAEDLQTIIDAAVPAFEAKGLTVSSTVSGNEGVLTLSGGAVGKVVYSLCDSKLYSVQAACSKDKPVISEVINSVTCNV